MSTKPNVCLLVVIRAGVYTGSLTGDRYLRSAGFLGENHGGGEVLVVKCHFDFCPHLSPGELSSRYQRFIHIVRNPFHAIVAERKRVTGGGHFGSSDVAAFFNGSKLTKGNTYQARPPAIDYSSPNYEQMTYIGCVSLSIRTCPRAIASRV